MSERYAVKVNGIFSITTTNGLKQIWDVVAENEEKALEQAKAKASASGVVGEISVELILDL